MKAQDATHNACEEVELFSLDVPSAKPQAQE